MPRSHASLANVVSYVCMFEQIQKELPLLSTSSVSCEVHHGNMLFKVTFIV